MTEHNEEPAAGHPAQPPSGQAPPAGPSASPPVPPGEPGEGGGEQFAAPPRAPRGARFRRWAALRPVQLVSAGVLGFVIGGVVVGAVAAAAGGDGHDGFGKRHMIVRVPDGMRGGPGEWGFQRGGPDMPFGGKGRFGCMDGSVTKNSNGTVTFTCQNGGGTRDMPMPVPAQPGPAQPGTAQPSPVPSPTAS